MNYLTRNEFLDNWIVSFVFFPREEGVFRLLAYRLFASHRQFSSASFPFFFSNLLVQKRKEKVKTV